jgi:predicted GNAT family acetyltransferase
MRLRVEDDPDRGRYVVYAGDRRAGLLTYRREGDVIALDHTEVDEDFEGEGVGSALVRHALDAAREDGIGVLPFCSFTRSYMERHPEYQELVPAAQRDRFGFEDQPS